MVLLIRSCAVFKNIFITIPCLIFLNFICYKKLVEGWGIMTYLTNVEKKQYCKLRFEHKFLEKYIACYFT